MSYINETSVTTFTKIDGVRAEHCDPGNFNATVLCFRNEQTKLVLLYGRE